MIERVIENWLTSANERQYQIPFCQLLASEGETVVYISTHGALEQGKDVITVGTDKIPRAYQLKGGKLNLNDWRSYKGEIDELVEIPISHPSVQSRQSHRSFLVTNGPVADTVLNRIEASNRVWKKHNPKPLRLIQGSELVSRFVKAHGSFLPKRPEDFRNFLTCIVSAGVGPFNKAQFATFLETVLPLKGRVSPLDGGRSLSSAVLLTSYIVQGCERAANHWAVFECWIMMASYVLAMAAKHSLPKKSWSTPFELCELAALRALDLLCEECAENQTYFTQGDPFTDASFYPVRMTILAGALSALSLSRRLKSESFPRSTFVHEFLDRYLRRVQIWGESASPFVMAAALELERHGHHARSEGLAGRLAGEIIRTNGNKGRGLPNPYYQPEDAVRSLSGMDTNNAEIFVGNSYTLELLVEFFTRRLLRRTLASSWKEITKIHYLWFQPSEDWEWFRWKAEGGSLDSRMANTPQSWSALLATAEHEEANVPDLLKTDPSFCLFFKPCISPAFRRRSFPGYRQSRSESLMAGR